MPRLERELDSLAATATFGRDLAMVLRPGDVVRLDGELGAGKTTLARAIATALGANPALVNSPTFVLINHYPTNEGRPDITHVDCYRISGPDDLESLGWDTIESSDDAVLIEWGERIETVLPDDTARVTLEPTGDESRLATIEIPDSWSGRPGIGGLEARRATVCPATGAPVPADSPTWPFATERDQMADLCKWFSGQHSITRPLDQRDLEEGVD